MTKSFTFALLAACAIGFGGFATDAFAVDGVAKTGAAVETVKKDGIDMGHKKMDRAKFHEEMFARTDKDGDGLLSKDEFVNSHKERALKAFDDMDTNKDGKLSKEELKEGRQKWHKKMRAHGKGPGMGGGMGGPGHDGPRPPHGEKAPE